MQVRIASKKTLKNSIYFGGCDKRQRYWWLYSRDERRFVDIGNRYIPGNKPLDIDVDLDAGRYEVGVGPLSAGVRLKFDVGSESGYTMVNV